MIRLLTKIIALQRKSMRLQDEIIKTQREVINSQKLRYTKVDGYHAKKEKLIRRVK